MPLNSGELSTRLRPLMVHGHLNSLRTQKIRLEEHYSLMLGRHMKELLEANQGLRELDTQIEKWSQELGN